MCGIFGLIGTRWESSAEAALDPLRARGPDASGFWHGAGALLGHTRLSVIDLAGGAQPMASNDGRYVIVYNGEIYNFQALRRELESKGHRFRSRSDSEVLVHLYEEEGLGFLDRLRGMFALALWDGRRPGTRRRSAGEAPMRLLPARSR